MAEHATVSFAFHGLRGGSMPQSHRMAMLHAPTATLLLCLAVGPVRAGDAGKPQAQSSGKDASDQDDDDKPDPKKEAGKPNLYLDLSTTYTSSSGPSFITGFARVPTISGASSKSLTFTAPLTYEPSEHLSFNVGIDGSTSKSPGQPWSRLQIGNVTGGFSADIFYKDKWPTVTLNGSVSRPADPNSLPLGVQTTTWVGGLDLDYSLNEDDTAGLIAGASLTRILIDAGALRRVGLTGSVNPAYLSYAGAYYEWSNNWKLTGRVGLVTFGGAQIGTRINVRSSNQPFGKLDLERLDDDGNTLFGVSAVVVASPKPSLQFILSTPLYAIRN